MKKKIVLYLNHYAGVPGISPNYRAISMGKHWAAQNIDITIVCASYHHYHFKDEHQLEDIIKDAVTYKFIKTRRKYTGNGINRIVNMLQYAFGVFQGKFISSNKLPNVIIATSVHPFTLLSGWWIARKYNAKFIIEIRDIWPLSIIQLTGISKYHPICIAIKLIERFTYPKADALVSVLPTSKPYFINNGMAPDKFTYIPNGADVSIKKLKPLKNQISKSIFKWKKEKYFCLVYTGGHGGPNALKGLIEAMVIINKSSEIKIKAILVGDGIYKTRLQEYVQEMNIENIHFFDPVVSELIPSILAAADCGYIGWLDMSLYEYGVSPNKLFEYMKAKLPIIHSINVEKEQVEMAKCGLKARAENPKDIAETIIKMSKIKFENPNKFKKMGSNGYRFLKENHNYKTLSAQYEMLFNHNTG